MTHPLTNKISPTPEKIAASYQRLDWDSHIFTFKVAKITPACLTPDALHQILIQLKKQQIRLVYWAADSQDACSQQAAQQYHGWLADRKVTYVMSTAIHLSACNHHTVETYTALTPNRELEYLALQSGLYSRFKMDPRIPLTTFETLYKQWIANSTNKTIAQQVLVIRQQNQIIGMVTLGQKKNRGDIGLLAVHPDHRGRQIGSQLVMAAQCWFRQQGYAYGQVLTQQENQPACRLYEKCGFQIEKTEHFYHFWLDA